MILTIQSLSISFEDRVLFQNINLSLAQGERLALVGANGCGKTTLLRLITGELAPDAGQVALGKHVRLGYASQEAGSGSQESGARDLTVYEAALEVSRHLMDMERELEEIHERLHDDHSPALLHRREELQTAYERGGGLTYKARARSALIGLGFPEEDHAKPARLLSGGQDVKLRLGRLLLSGAELLLLDEPTNHLDVLAIRWLEGFLSAYPGTIVLVSHDRTFLDRVATKTAALSHGKLAVYKGGYSACLQQKQALDEQAKRNYENQMAEIRRIEGIIEQQRRFNQKRNYVTIASKQKQIDRLRAELVVPESHLRELSFRFPSVPVTGDEVLRITGLSKSFGAHKLFSNLNALIEKGDRAFILGANGCGKTTLLNILRRRLKAEEGYFVWGANVRVGSYDQTLQRNFDSVGGSTAKTVLDEVWDSFRTLTQTEIRSALGLFLFSGDDVFKPVDALSGGERARVALLKLMMSGANVLLLDEPTNHLDIPSREALERALSQFEGTVVAVSHDRFLVKKLATKVFGLFSDGLHPCDVEAAMEMKPASAAAQPGSRPAGTEYHRKKEEASRQRRLAASLKRCEEEIAGLEQSIAGLQAELEANADGYEAVLRISSALHAREARLEEQMERWEELSGEIE